MRIRLEVQVLAADENALVSTDIQMVIVICKIQISFVAIIIIQKKN